MTERNEMPTPVPMWLKELACAEANKDNPGAELWLPTDFPYGPLNATARLLWERGEREPVDPEFTAIEEALEKCVKGRTRDWRDWPGTVPIAQIIHAAIKRERAMSELASELAEAKP